MFHQCLNTKGKNLYWPAKKELQITTACTLIYFISFFLRLLFLAMFVTSHLVLFACSRKKFLNSSNERERKVYFFPPLFVSSCFYTMLASTRFPSSYSQQWQDSRPAQQLAKKKNDNDTSLKKNMKSYLIAVVTHSIPILRFRRAPKLFF